MRIWVICRKTSEFGASGIGIHLKQPTDSEIYSALDTCATTGHNAIYIYHSKRSAITVADMLTDTYDLMIGWRDFMSTDDGFVLDTDKVME